MALGTNVAESIALQRPNRNDYWMRRLADDMRLAKETEKKRKQQEADQLATLMDFKIDYSKYLPAWGKKITEIYSGMINNVAKMRQGDPNVSYYALKNEVERAKQEMANYQVGNDQAMKYIERNDIMKDADYVRAMLSTESTLESLNEMSNAGFYVTSPTGSFFYREVSNKPVDIKWGDPNREMPAYDANGKVRVYDTKDQRYNVLIADYSPEKISAVVNEAQLNPLYRLQTLFDLSRKDKKYQQDISMGQTDSEYAAKWTDDIDGSIEQNTVSTVPPPIEKLDALPVGGGGRGDGGGERKRNAPLTKSTHRWAGLKTGTPTVVDTWVKSVYTMNGIKLTSNDDFLTTDGKRIGRENPKDGKNISFYFRPTTVEILPVTEKGVQTYKPYVRGIITMNQQSEDGSKLAEWMGITEQDIASNPQKYSWTNTQDIFVPLENSGVKGLIDYSNVMNDFYNKLDELNSGGSSRSGGGGAGDDIF